MRDRPDDRDSCVRIGPKSNCCLDPQAAPSNPKGGNNPSMLQSIFCDAPKSIARRCKHMMAKHRKYGRNLLIYLRPSGQFPEGQAEFNGREVEAVVTELHGGPISRGYSTCAN